MDRGKAQPGYGCDRHPEQAKHRKLQTDFILRIQEYARENNLDKETLKDEIVVFLRDWALNHIQKA